ncbi:MAG: hypothetical protein WCS50_03475, partial [Bacilli bacterium]
MKIIRILFVIFVAVFFAGCVTFSNDDTYWFAELEEELTSYELAPDTHEIYLIMKNENVSELYIE